MKKQHKPTVSKAYLTARNMFTQTATAGIARKITIEQYSVFKYDIATVDGDAQFIPEDLVIISTGWLDKVSAKTTSIVVHDMMPNLKKNNALWHYHPTSGYARAAIAQMRRIGILLTTEEPDIHFVNPEFIRKGSRVGVLAMTMRELKDCGRVSLKNIRDLRNGKADVSPFELGL
jgi:hypothetical protein